MPTLRINTNIDGSKFDETFIKEVTVELAAAMGKPEKFISIVVSANQIMSFGGSTESCAIVKLTSIGSINEELNSKYSELLFPKFENLGIKKERMYIIFEDVTRDMVAWNGRLFSAK